MTYISGRVLKGFGTRPALHVLKKEQYEYDKFKHTSKESSGGEPDFTSRRTGVIRAVEGRGCSGSWNIKTGVIQVVEDRHHARLFFRRRCYPKPAVFLGIKKKPRNQGLYSGPGFSAGVSERRKLIFVI